MALQRALLFLFTFSCWAAIPESQQKTIDEITGAKGSYTAGEDVYRVTFPRTDVAVAIEGRGMHPFMGFISWAAFTPGSHGGLMVMGDLVLFEDEVNPVMSAALDAGLEVTALHNHFFFESPRVMFMHIGGHGAADQLATGVKQALAKVREIRAANAQPGSRFAGPVIPGTNSIPAAAIDGILGLKGQTNAGMYKAVIGREAKMHGKTVGNQMGVNTWAAFAGTEQAALVDGDFAMLENEVQPVLKALRKAGIQVVAIHNHMTHEEPHYVFLHYWGKGPAAELARGLRSALDAQKQTTLAAASAPVIFVCEHGAAKSVIAAEYFNKLAVGKGLALRAVARGTNPDPEFSAKTLEGLRGDGFAVSTGRPQALTAGEAGSARLVVTLDLRLPVDFSGIQAEEWKGIPGPSANYGGARNDIQARVEALIQALSPSNH
jgi:protein-tyrosine-phosphatase